MKRVYLHWTDDEIEYLKQNYGLVERDELVSSLRNRNYSAIVKKAKVLGVKHCKFACKKSKLEILLEDNPITYYWIGFLMADGCFTDRRIPLGVVTKDLEHLQRFLSYIDSTNSICAVTGNYHRVTITNISIVQQIREKFGISSKKTYEPRQIQKLPKNDLLFSLIVGFIDGDGSITKNKTFQKCHRLCVVGHSSWLKNFVFMSQFLHQHLGFDQPKRPAYIREVCVCFPQNENKTTHQLSTFYINRKQILFKIKALADNLGLPYLQRKLGKIHC